MRFCKLSTVGFVVALTVSILWFWPTGTKAQDALGTPTADETENEPPARETPNFFRNEPQTSQPSTSPAPSASPVAGETEQPDEDRHLGIGKFARFPVKFSVSLQSGYDDNVITTSANGSASAYINPETQLDYKFGDARTEISLRGNAGVIYYFNGLAAPTPPPNPFGPPPPKPITQDYDLTLSLGGSLVHNVSQRLVIGGTVFLTYQTEPNFSTNVGENRRSGNYFYSSDRVFANYQWLPRFSTATSYTLAVIKYDDATYSQFLDRSEHLVGTQFQFLYTRDTTLIVDLRTQIVSYDNPGTLDSMTELLLAGLEHKFNPRMTTSLRGGWQYRSFENGHIRREPYFEGTLNYAAGKRTTLSWSNYYRLEEPGVSGNQGRTTFRTGIQANYGLTTRLTTTLGFYYVHDDYEVGPRPPSFLPGIFPRPPGAPAFSEDSLDLALGLRYDFRRNFAIEVGYNHTEISSDYSFREYSRNRYFAGLNLTF